MLKEFVTALLAGVLVKIITNFLTNYSTKFLTKFLTNFKKANVAKTEEEETPLPIYLTSQFPQKFFKYTVNSKK